MHEFFAPAPLWLLAVAMMLEWKLTWPRSISHPVRLIGWLLDRLEQLARKSTDLRLSGALCLLVALSTVGLLCAALIRMPFLGWLVAVALGASGLALGELVRSCREALYTLEADEAAQELTKARRCIAQLVSRDTSMMDAPNLRRALAETLAENFNDAVVAPLCYLAVGGPIGLWLYKTVSTMDSMWGYTTPAWKELGMAGARCDDWLAWVPARISVLLLWLAWWVQRLQGNTGTGGRWPGWRVIREQAGQMASPNAGWPMAAAAWLHGAGMGGPTPYFGKLVEKARLGPISAQSDSHATHAATSTQSAQYEWDTRRLECLLDHVRCAGWLALALAILVHVVLL